MSESGPGFDRPEGVAGSFAPRTGADDDPPFHTAPPPTQSPARLPPEVTASYQSPWPDRRPFDPPAARLTGAPATNRAAGSLMDRDRFGPGRPGVIAFDPPAADRISPTNRRPESPWWADGAEHDPWRDPGSPFSLGRPAVFVDGRPAPAEGDVEPAEPIPSAEPGGGPRSDRRRFGLSAVLLSLLLALVAGTLGGGTGYFLANRANGVLTDRGLTLGTAGAPANRPPGSVAGLAKRVTPAVVSIEVRTSSQIATGSGVVIAKVGDGAYILTNNHVVSAAATGSQPAVAIRVSFADNSTATAAIVGRDTLTDLAVLKVAKTDVTVASLGDSSGLAVGDPVLAIGSPLGLSGSVTSGIVSALNRPVRLSGEGSDTNAVISAIQTDAAINPGNSGGALVDASGAIIGINSAIASTGQSGGNIGVGFAIPINTARTVAQELIQTGKAIHSTLGVNARSVTDGSRDGAYLVQVLPAGPAAAAGLQDGDVITKLDQLTIGSSDELTVAVQQRAPGTKVTITYYRATTQATATATLGTA